MARFLSNSNLVAALSRKGGYSSAASAMGRASSRKAAEEQMMMMKGSKNEGGGVETVTTSSWVPDPVTGYYMPANRVGEMDPAELRRILLSRKF